VTVTKTGYKDVGTVSGEVCITNGGAQPTENLSILLDLAKGGPPVDFLNGVSVGTASMPVLAAGASYCYPYAVDVTGYISTGDNIKVTSNITITNHSGHLGEPFGPSPSENATVVYSEVNASVTVSDSWAGTLGPFSGDGGSISYSRTFACGEDAGTHDNTATIDQTRKTASASVVVNCYELSVTKDAKTTLTRTWAWTIEKSADQSSLTLALGQTFIVNYTVTVPAPTSSDSDWAVTGTITITNPAPMDATLISVTDLVSPDIAADVTCPSLTVPANGSLTCTYSADLPDASARTNSATAILQNSPSGTTDFSGTANVSFETATVTNTDDCITISDSYAGDLGQMCVGSAPQTFTYARTVGPYQTCGSYTVDNTATFVTTETEATGSASVSIPVNVPCAGCTLTLGYWKTHSSHGPAPYDDAWLAIGPSGADTLFFNTGKTWYQIFQTPPAGNQFYNLAHQYMAAKLNILNGAASTPAVDAAISAAETYFNGLAPNTIPTGKLSKNLVAAASLLDKYNNGLIGPGHCSEQIPA
jgi:hypothetical protein